MNKNDTLPNEDVTDGITTEISDGTSEARFITTRLMKTSRKKEVAITLTEMVHGEGYHYTKIHYITKSDAETIIRQLRSAFDIPNEERQMIELLQNQLDASQELIENLSAVTVANIMYENGLRTAVLTPSRIVSGLTPALEIDATRPDQVKYILKEEPLNAQDTTDNGRLDS